MDKITLQGQTDFALTTDALAFMQSAYSLLEKLTAVVGDNFILSGCTESGGAVTSGFMVLKGILMPFSAGSIQTNVRIIEEVNTINVDVASREQTTYRAEFGTSSDPAQNVAWADIKRFDNIFALMTGQQTNADNIQQNADDIQINADGIQTNANGIQTNADNIQQNADDISAIGTKLLFAGFTSSSLNPILTKQGGTLSPDISAVNRNDEGQYVFTHNFGAANYVAIVFADSDDGTYDRVSVRSIQQSNNGIQISTRSDTGHADTELRIIMFEV